MQPSGRIDEEHVDAPGLSRSCSIEHDGRRVGSFLMLYDRHVVPFSPNRQLLRRSGAERVAGNCRDLVSLLLKFGGQLADCGGFAGAVDADHQDNKGLFVRARHMPRFFPQARQRGEESLWEKAGKSGPDGSAEGLRCGISASGSPPVFARMPPQRSKTTMRSQYPARSDRNCIIKTFSV